MCFSSRRVLATHDVLVLEQTCVTTGHFTAALPVLQVPITHVDPTLSDLTYNDNLVYHYAGGVALGALKRWQEAEEFFEICVSAPAQVPAAIQLEAFKKLMLVQLIQYGEVRPSLFSWSDQVLIRPHMYGLDRPATKIHAPGTAEALQELAIQQLRQELPLLAGQPPRVRRERERLPKPG